MKFPLLGVVLATISWTAAACDDDSCDPVAFCDGNADTLFSFRTSAPVGSVMYGEKTQIENGFMSLFVDGSCRFWASDKSTGIEAGGSGHWGRTYTGQLSERQEEDLSRDLCIGKLDDLDDRLYDHSSFDDGGYTYLAYKGKGVICYADGCDGEPYVGEIRENARDWVGTLLAQGTPVEEDSLRATAAIGLESSPQYDHIELQPVPEGFDIASIAVTVGEAMDACYGESVRLEGDYVPALTALRDSYLAGEHGDWYYPFLPMVDTDGIIYELYFRDECPLEDARGLVREKPYDTDECVSL